VRLEASEAFGCFQHSGPSRIAAWRHFAIVSPLRPQHPYFCPSRRDLDRCGRLCAGEISAAVDGRPRGCGRASVGRGSCAGSRRRHLQNRPAVGLARTCRRRRSRQAAQGWCACARAGLARSRSAASSIAFQRGPTRARHHGLLLPGHEQRPILDDAIGLQPRQTAVRAH
jgi:hypothetical protein